MPSFVELRFHIDAFSPATMPMRVLADFLGDLAVILGEQKSVHFNRLEGGSTTPVLRVEYEAVPAVIERAGRVRINEAPEDALKAKQRVESRLVAFNARNAELTDEAGGRILLFRGRDTPREQIYGPVRQQGELVGSVIMIGGRNDPVAVHVADSERFYKCSAKKDVARKVTPYLLTDQQVRLSGYGKHYRNDQGAWEMQDFRITDCAPLDGTPFIQLLNQMREVKGEWLPQDIAASED